MTVSVPRPWLVCYDIRDRKRLAKVHRYVANHALPVQFSVFLIHADLPTVQRHLSRLALIINPKEDDVRCYPFSRDSHPVCLGTNLTPDQDLLQTSSDTGLRGWLSDAPHHP